MCKVKLGYEYCYLYAALQPFSGQLISLLLPDMRKESFAAFVDYFREETEQLYGTEAVLLITDGAGAHQQSIVKGSHITLQKLPAVSPELNPVERFFEELRKQLANYIFDNIEAVQDKLCQVLTKYYDNPKAIVQLSNYPYLSAT